MKQGWSIVVFGYNEAANFPRVLKDVCELLKEIADPFEIIAIDDGSRDGTERLLNDLKDKMNLRVIIHAKNLGIGYSLREGYRSARYENVCAVPADGQFDIFELRKAATLEASSFVAFHRVQRPGYSPFRTFISGFNKWINSFFLNIDLKDINWVKVYKREDLQALPLKLTSSVVESEICARLLQKGFKVIEVESEYLPRLAGESKGASLPTVLRALREVGKLIFVTRIQRTP